MTDELIERFFKKECTAQEAAEVSKYLKNNPAVLERYLSVQEWFGAGSEKMPEEFWNEGWSAIEDQRRPVVKLRWIGRAAAAAVMIISAGLIYKGLYVKDKPVTTASVEKQLPQSQRKITVNNSGELMNIALPDSSEVILSPGSLITYNIPFPETTRQITLDGEGRFNVMKDEKKPFTVFAGGLATTALGTEFTINTKNHVSVKLHSGRVMITAGEGTKQWKKNIILEPGQQLNYDMRKMVTAVGSIKSDMPVAKNIVVKKPKKIPAPEAGGLDFMNTSLPEVMDRLTGYYRQRITFDSTELGKMNFTGRISKNDSLHIVLKVIAQMNGLMLDHDENGYELKKSEK